MLNSPAPPPMSHSFYARLTRSEKHLPPTDPPPKLVSTPGEPG